MLEKRLQAGDDSVETLQVPSYARLFFGLKPTSDILILRPAIAQTLAMTMAVVSIVLRRFIALEEQGLAMFGFLLLYAALSVMAFGALDYWNRAPGR